MTDEQQTLDWMQLARTRNVGPVTFYRLLDRFGTAKNALEELPSFSKQAGRKKVLHPAPRKDVEKEYSRIRKSGGDVLCLIDERYPSALSAIEDAPPVITLSGNLDLLQSKESVAIVGSRKASTNGLTFTRHLAKDLGTRGYHIVSGLARGIDTAAHQGSIDTGTIAVIAGGLDNIYPPENENLYAEIREKGVIVAESPLGSVPRAQDFPRRNRIISGLSHGVAVIEATERSGSLITANLAAEQGRDVFAVPGHPMDPRSQGTNRLIRDGATLIRNAEDILETLQDFSGLPKSIPSSSRPQQSGQADMFQESAAGQTIKASNKTNTKQEKTRHNEQEQTESKTQILQSLSAAPVTIDDIIRQHQIPVHIVQTSLLELELSGEIERLPGGRVALLSK